MRCMKLYLLVFTIFLTFFTIQTASANIRSSETLRGEKGLFRLMSADINEAAAYHFRTSIEFSQQDELIKDTSNSNVQSKKGGVAFGYSILPEVLLSGYIGYVIDTRRPQAGSPGAAQGSEQIDLVRYGFAATGTYDVGKFFSLPQNRFTAGFSLWTNLSKITRFFKALDIQPTLIASADFTDNQAFPFRTHFNLGFRPANGGRYFNSDSQVTDFSRYATDTINSPAFTTAVGVEFPMPLINPSLEMHMQKVMDASFGRAPKWMTIGAKGKPFPQKNVELFAAIDVGLTSFKGTPIPPPKPEVGPVPLWNIVLGFGVAQFGKRAGEIGVDQLEFEQTKARLEDRERTMAALQKDLEFNTIQGSVVDASTKKPMENVSISFPDAHDLKASKTDANGKFIRYFRNLGGARVVFSKEGYESSSKFLSLKPGEKVTTDIELKKSTNEVLADFIATITNATGSGIAATVTLTDVQSNQSTVAVADGNGQVQVKLKEGSYRMEIKASGYKSLNERIDFQRGKTIIRSYTMSK